MRSLLIPGLGALVATLARPSWARDTNATPAEPATTAVSQGVDADADELRAGAEKLEPESRASLRGDSPLRTEERWYGWQTLVTDGGSLLLLIAGASAVDSDGVGGTVAAAALVGYLLGGPIVHLAHENPGRALGSLALRAGAPIALGFVGVQLEDCGNGGGDFCGLGGAVLGGALGILSAVVIDASVLARESVPTETSAWSNVGVAVGREQVTIVTRGTF